MKAKRKRRMSRRRRERTYIAVMVLLAIAVSIGLTRSVMRDDKEFEEYEQQSQEFNARMQRIDEKREASGQNAMLEQVRTWQQEQDTEPDKYAVFDTMSADWGGEEDGFVLYEIPEEYSRTDVTLLNHEFTVIDDERLKVYREEGWELHENMAAADAGMNTELIEKGRALCEEERETIWAMQLDGLTETQACEEYFLTKHTEYNNFSICYIPNKEVFAECVAVFGERY